MKDSSLRELFVDELRDLYDAENRLIKALPKLAKKANLGELRSGFETHLTQTKEHAERLKRIMVSLDEKPSGRNVQELRGSSRKVTNSWVKVSREVLWTLL